MKLPIILILTFSFLGCFTSFAQSISTNENGDTIIRFDDGSWRYYDKNDDYDQFIMEKHLNDPKSKRDDDQPATVLAVPSIAESINQIDVLNLKVFEAKIALEDAQDEKEILQDQVKLNKKAKKELKVSMLKSLLKKKKQEIKMLKKHYKLSKQQVAYYQRELKKTKRSSTNDEDDFISENEGVSQKDENQESSEINSKKQDDYAKYSADKDVLYHPPVYPCQYLDTTEQIHSKLIHQKFFSYSPPAMKNNHDNKNKDYIHCTGQISKIKGGNLVLNLVITIASETAKNEYGLIEKGSMMILKMVDKSSISVRSRQTTIGRSNEVDKSIIYESSYNIPSGFVKKLKTMELDKVKIIWSTGYEEYEIYETDFFMNQLNCFK